MSKYKIIIGLEVHIELSTERKMFCGCPADHFSKKPNTQVCPICLGLPGALPFPNKKAIELVIKTGLSYKSKINQKSKFDRKHYFYPDLPKGYQISQYEIPLCEKGEYKLKNGYLIKLTRIHLEEDTAKLVHDKEQLYSLIDFNRSGVPLMELVTDPFLNESVDEATENTTLFLKDLMLNARLLGVSSADMEKGSMRLEANISLTKNGSKDNFVLPEYKVELKNINSFKFLNKAIKYEVKRQEELLNKGKKIPQETRGFDEQKTVTFLQRTKEEAKDYRYFPEPDIPPMEFSEKDILILKKGLPKTVGNLREEYTAKYNLPDDYMEILISEMNKARYFEHLIKLTEDKKYDTKKMADLVINRNIISDYPEPESLVLALEKTRAEKSVSKKDTEIVVGEVVKQNQKAVDDYRKGKKQVIGYLIGEVQKNMSGKCDPKIIVECLKKILK